MAHSTLRVLKNRNYQMYFFGQLVSLTGTWMQGVAQSWLVYRLSHSGAWLGLVGFAIQFPAFLLSPVAGAIADKYDRRKILLAVQIVSMVQAFVLAGLIFSGKVQLWHVVVLAALLGSANGFEITTRHAFGVDMVGKDDLPGAIVLNSVLMNLSRMVGPALAGMVLAVVGEGWCFLLNALSYLAVIWGLWKISVLPREPYLMEKGMLRQIGEGMKYAVSSRRIMAILVISAVLCFLAAPALVLLPIFAKTVLHGDARTLALLTAAVGAGAVVGALSSARLSGAGKLWTQLAVATMAWAVSLLLMGFSRSAALTAFAALLGGFSMMNVFPAMNNAIQQMVDDRMRARVLSIYTMSFLGAMPLGSLAMGWASDHIGAPHTTLLAGFVTFAIGVFVLAVQRRWRTNRRGVELQHR